MKLITLESYKFLYKARTRKKRNPGIENKDGYK